MTESLMGWHCVFCWCSTPTYIHTHTHIHTWLSHLWDDIASLAGAPHIYTYIYTYIHTYKTESLMGWHCVFCWCPIHTYIHTYITTYIPAWVSQCINKAIHTYTHYTKIYLHDWANYGTVSRLVPASHIHTYVLHTYIHTYICTYIHTYIHKNIPAWLSQLLNGVASLACVTLAGCCCTSLPIYGLILLSGGAGIGSRCNGLNGMF